MADLHPACLLAPCAVCGQSIGRPCLDGGAAKRTPAKPGQRVALHIPPRAEPHEARVQAANAVHERMQAERGA